MSYQNISVAIVAADKTTVLTSIQAIKAKLPFLINLNPAERKRIRKMGAIRRAYVQDVYAAIVNNPTAAPSGFNVVEFGKDVQLMKDITDILGVLLPVYDGIVDTSFALGNELMKQADEAYGYLKVAAKKSSNQSLNQTIQNISVQLKHKASAAETNPTVE